MASSPDSSECPFCHLPFSASTSQRSHSNTACPFCHKVFGRVDGARRHAKTCPSRDGRPLPPEAKRGRKARACDACSRIKVSCNAQVPCQRCSARKLRCTYGRVCAYPAHHRQGSLQISNTTESVKKASPFPFLLSCTDPRVNFVNDVMVPGEPERDPATASSTAAPSLTYSPAYIDNRIASSDTIDPRLLFHGFMDPYFGMSLDDGGMDDNFSLDMDLDFPTTGTLPLSSIASAPTTQDMLTPRVISLEADLLQLVASQPGPVTTLYSACKSFFSSADFHRLISVFFRRQQLLAKMIHWPTFDAAQVDVSLLLAIALCGVAYVQSSPSNSSTKHATAKLVSSASAIQPLAEKYIFKRLKTICQKQKQNTAKDIHALEICQAAYLVVLLQISVNDSDNTTRRRAMTKCQPALVDALRHLGILTKRPSLSATTSSAERWCAFVYNESCSRLALWVFFSDGFLALFCNAPPNTTVAEMTGAFPCRDELWDAVSAELFEEEQKNDGQHSPLPFVKDVLSALMGENEDAWQSPASQALTVFHLYSVVGALQFVLFTYRFNALPPTFGNVLLRALDRWDRLWTAALARVAPHQQRWLGVAKYSPEFARIAKRIIEVSEGRGDGRSSNSVGDKYLQCTPEYDLRVFHAFILEYGTP